LALGRAVSRWSLAAVAVAAFSAVTPAAAETIVSPRYAITLAGVYIGSVEAHARFVDGGYAIALTGSVGGIPSVFTNAAVQMASRGNISGTRVLPAYFEIELREGRYVANVEMDLDRGDVTDLYVVPGLEPAFDLISLTIEDVQDVLDPMSALFVPTDGAELTGRRACDRTIPVFDGWQRYDLRMSHQTTRTVIGERDAHAGPVHVCSVNYVPVAGHRLSNQVVSYLAYSERLEVWLVPVAEADVLIPYRLLIGTEVGDLVVRLERLSLDAAGGS